MTVADAETAVTELAAAKVDMIKAVHDDGLGSSLAPEVLQTVVGVARERRLRAFFHPGSVANAIAAVGAGADAWFTRPGQTGFGPRTCRG